MRGWLVLLLATPLLGGCQTHLVLKDNSVKMANSLTDLNYQQTLNNVALFVHDPASLPSIAAITIGTAAVADQLGYSGNANYSPTLTFQQQGGGALPILTLLFNPSAQRQFTENWSLLPITDADHLRRIRCAFQLLVQDAGADDCDNCRSRLVAYFVTDEAHLECYIPHGWYHVGCAKDVPKDACYVGSYHDTYVWVMPDGIEGLTRFTITIIDLTSGKPHTPTKTVVKTFKADGKLDTIQETTTVVDHEAIGRLRDIEFLEDRPRKTTLNLYTPVR
jgi:hypothetical protein